MLRAAPQNRRWPPVSIKSRDGMNHCHTLLWDITLQVGDGRWRTSTRGLVWPVAMNELFDLAKCCTGSYQASCRPESPISGPCVWRPSRHLCVAAMGGVTPAGCGQPRRRIAIGTRPRSMQGKFSTVQLPILLSSATPGSVAVVFFVMGDLRDARKI